MDDGLLPSFLKFGLAVAKVLGDAVGEFGRNLDSLDDVTEKVRENFFADVRVATFAVEAGAPVVGVLRFLALGGHRAAAPAAGKQAHEGVLLLRVSAPSRMSLDTIRIYAISKLAWIKQQQKKLQKQEREKPREYLDRESHYVWGRRYLLTVSEGSQEASVALTHNRMLLRVRSRTNRKAMHAVVEKWYRDQVRTAVPALLAKWEPLIGVEVERVFVQRMKTKWGSCSPTKRSIRLNTDLAKKPRECLEYIVVHEMVHLLERTHNARFVAVMDRVMPQWPYRRAQLNRLPLRHQDWTY